MLRHIRSAALLLGLTTFLSGMAAVAQEPAEPAWHLVIHDIYGAEGVTAVFTLDPGLVVAKLVSSEEGHPTHDIGRRSLTAGENEIIRKALADLASAGLKTDYRNPNVSDGYQIRIEYVAPDGRESRLSVANMEIPELNALIAAVNPLLPPTPTGRPALHTYTRSLRVVTPNPAPVATKELFDELAERDRMLYDAVFNTCDLEILRRLVTADFEMYHDKSGLVANSGRRFVQNIRDLCDRRKWGADYPARRELVEGTLEVFPLDHYGAIQMGVHRFYREGGTQPVEVSRFTHIWKKEADGTWKLARAMSYDHKLAE